MRFLLAAAMVAVSLPAAALAQPAPVAASPHHYSVTDTSVGTLLDDPAAKAILDKRLPGLSVNPRIALARPLTLAALEQYAPDKITDQILADIQVDFNALPPRP